MINKQNHELFRLIYGDFEYSRLRHIFEQEPEDIQVGADWEMPPLKLADYNIRLLCLAGTGSIHYIKKLIRNKAILKEIAGFIFVENDPKVICQIVNDSEFNQLVRSPRVKFCFNMNEETVKPNLFRILKQPNFSEIMELACCYWNKQETDPERLKYYEDIASSLKETVNHIYTNYGEMNDSLEGIRATLVNKDKILTCPGIEDLKNAYKGMPALVVAAGPSLDKALETIKANKDKYIIIAADAAVKPLIKAGINPHYCTSIERLNLFQTPFWADLEPGETELICFPVVHPEVLKLYKGKVRLVYRNYSYYAYFEKNWPKGILACGSSTTNLAVRLAHYMGCSEVVFSGLDHAYEQRITEEAGVQYRSHCYNTGNSTWSEWHPIDYFEKEPRKHSPAFEIEAYDGKATMTNYLYYLWSKEFAEEAINLGIPLTATDGRGVKMAGIGYAPLTTVSESLPALEFKKVEYKPVTHAAKWEHSVLKQSLKGWARISEALLEIMKDELSPSVLSLINEIYNNKFVNEHMFVGFVVQNSAVEYYKLENEIHGLDTKKMDYAKYKDILIRRFTVFLEVLNKLDILLKENT